MKHLLLIFIILFFLTGCVTPYKAPKKYNIENERTYDLDYDRVWSSVLSFFWGIRNEYRTFR